MLIRSKKKLVASIIMAMMLFLCSFIIPSVDAFADVVTEHRDNVSFSITEQCLFQGTGTTSKTFSGTALNGQEIGGSTATNKFVDEDGAETNVHEFNVSCNVYTGYTVKAYATNLEHQLDFDPGNPDLILFVNDKPVTETSDSYDYLIANNDTQGYWTASVSGDDTSNTFSTNAAAPTTIKLGNTITAEDGDTFSVAYKAYVGKLTPPGSYNGEAVYILASNPTPDIPEDTVFQYNITYDANGGTGLTTTSQSGTAQGSTTITPPTGLVGPEGEEFTGWSKTQGADDIDFPAGENITLTSTTFASYPATLYAVYGNYMQNFTAEKCAAIATYDQESEFQLADKRTGAKYFIRKLRDNNCWMVQNLWLPGEIELTPEYSDITENNVFVLPVSSTTFNTSDSGQTKRMYSGNHEDNLYDNNSTNTGSWFNWYTATAGSGNGRGSSTLYRPVSGKADQAADSVCPRGWKLPTSYKYGGQYTVLNALYGGTSARCETTNINTVWSFTAQGAWLNGSLFVTDTSVWWSSVQASSVNYYNSFYAQDYISNKFCPWGTDDGNNGKSFGFSVRCVLVGSDTTNPW